MPDEGGGRLVAILLIFSQFLKLNTVLKSKHLAQGAVPDETFLSQSICSGVGSKTEFRG